MPEFVTEPVDSDVDLHVQAQRSELRRAPWEILGLVSGGGVLGALARYGLATAWPHPPGGFPWATAVTNVAGCLLIGVLMAIWGTHRLLRPFLGTGVLGGFTTFSTYAVDVQQMVVAGEARMALAYLAGTLACALAATYAGLTITRRSAGRRWSR